MKKGFVITENFRRMAEAQQAVDRRGAAEAGLVIVKGQFGIGKSKIVERLAVDSGAVFLRAKETWTKRALLDELAGRLGLDTRGRNSEVQARIIGRLLMDTVPLIFDEADFLVRSTPSLLECIRDITDTTGATCFLVGMAQFAHKLARYPHIASRVNRMVQLEPATLADVKAACDKLAEVALAPAVVEVIHAQSQGRMRLVLNAIANIEQWAEANGAKRVELEHIKGKALCVEFRPESAGRARVAA